MYDLDFECVSPMSESTPISKEKIEFYKSKYQRIILYHNNDKAGINANIRQSELYNCEYIFNPESQFKDYSDFIKQFSNEKDAYEEGKNLLIELLYGTENPPF